MERIPAKKRFTAGLNGRLQARLFLKRILTMGAIFFLTWATVLALLFLLGCAEKSASTPTETVYRRDLLVDSAGAASDSCYVSYGVLVCPDKTPPPPPQAP